VNRKLGLFLLLNLSTLVTAAEPKEDIARSFSLDSGYLPKLYSRRAIWTFAGEFDDVGSWGFDAVDRHTFIGDSALTRALWELIGSFGWYYLGCPMAVSVHEFGHGAGLSAEGVTPHYTWLGSSASHNNIFTFFLAGLGRTKGAYTSGSGTTGAIPDNWAVTISAGGINNSMMYAEYVEDEAYFQKGHILEYGGYLHGKFDGYNYVKAIEGGFVGDLNALRNFYNPKGYRVHLVDFESGSEVALFGSATHWAYILSGLRYMFNGNPIVMKPRLGRFRLPDVSHYALRNGLSYKLRSGFDFDRYHVPLYLEFVYKGKTSGEITTGMIRPISTSTRRKSYLSVLGVLNSQLAVGGRFQYDYPLQGQQLVSVGASLYQARTFDAERYVTRILGRDLGLEIWTRFSMLY
jgi:hypothetical protein